MRIKTFFIVIFTISITFSHAGEIPEFSVESHEFMSSWLLCGPFPNPLPKNVPENKDEYISAGFNIDYLSPLGGESTINPHTGLQFKALDNKEYNWQLYQGDSDYVDLCRFYSGTEEAIAYAVCHLVAVEDKTIFLGLGSDDGIKVWLNGELVWEDPFPRSVKIDMDYVPLQVKKGKNLLVLKIDQVYGNWGFYSRVLDRQEKINDLINELKVEYIRDIPFTIVSDSEMINAQFGKNSRYLILDQNPYWELQVFANKGKLVQEKTAPLGKTIRFPRKLFKDGPYTFQATINLPDQTHVIKKEYVYFGKSPHHLIIYDASGNPYTTTWYNRQHKPDLSPWKEDVALLDSKFETIEKGTRLEKQGIYSVQRYDVSPFYLRVNLPTLSLGTRMYLLDNLGAGYQIPKEKSFELDLPREALRCMQYKIEKRLQKSQYPQWLRQNIEKRLLYAKQLKELTPGHIYQALELLSSLKTNIEINSDFPVWFAPGIEKVGRDEPVPVIKQKKINLLLARNEYEPFQLVLRPEYPIEQLSVNFTVAKNEKGNQLSIDNFKVLHVDYVHVEKYTDFFGSKGDWPDALPQLTDSTKIPAGQNTPLWITVFAPKTQPPGTYNTTIHLFSKTKQVAEIPLEIDIMDFTIPEETHTETAYGVGVHTSYHGPIDNKQFLQVHDLYMQVCASHRISPYEPHRGAGFVIDIDKETNEISLDFTKFDMAMERYLNQFKFNAFNMGGLPGQLAGHERFTDRYNELFKKIYSNVQEHLREKGWLNKAYWYWVDEPEKVEYPHVRQGMEILKSACPDIRRLLTSTREDAPVAYFYDAVNLWVPEMSKYSQKKAHARQKLDETVMWYVCTGPKAPYPNNFITHPAINPRIRFWMLDAKKLDGSLYWSITAWYQNPWEQAMSLDEKGWLWGNGDGRLIYPPRRGKPKIPVIEPPVLSIRMENLRDGLEDRECFLLLRQIPAAEKLVTDIQTQAVPSLTAYEQNPALFFLARQRIYQALAEKIFE